MALKKPLVLGSDGSIEQLQSGDTLDIPASGGGGDTIPLTVNETVGNGSVVCATTSGIVNADKDDDSKTSVIGIATASGSPGNQIDVRVAAQMGGLSGLTAGNPVFLGNTGQLTQTLPTFGTVIRVGTAISATDMIVDISQPIKL